MADHAQRRRPPDPFVATLQARRIALGLSVVDVAEHSGYGRSSIYYWETGQRAPGPDALRAYAAAVEMRIELVPLTPPPLQITDSVVGLKADHHDSARLTRLGHSANEIATRLGCSQRTVQRHQARAREEAKSA